MTVHTRIATAADGERMHEELVALLAGRGVLNCAAVAAAVLDSGVAVASAARARQAGADPGAP